MILKHDFKPFPPENLRESGIESGFIVDGRPDIGKTVNGIAVNGKAITNKYYPDKISIYQSESRRFAVQLQKSRDRWMGWIYVQFMVENHKLFFL